MAHMISRPLSSVRSALTNMAIQLDSQAYDFEKACDPHYMVGDANGQYNVAEYEKLLAEFAILKAQLDIVRQRLYDVTSA